MYGLGKSTLPEDEQNAVFMTMRTERQRRSLVRYMQSIEENDKIDGQKVLKEVVRMIKEAKEVATFEKIKAHVEAGKHINQFSEDYAVIFVFLDSYYQHDVYGCSDIEEVPEDAVAEELRLPLAERPSGVLAQLEWLLAHGAKVNDSGDWQPLMAPVGALDVAMTQYLLEHGADPHFDIDEGYPPYGCGNYYIDDLDVRAMDASFSNDADESVFHRILQIALLFAQHGVTDVYTHCVSIDGETRCVSVSQARVKY